ncbi:DMT family transporter [Candidatus Pacearchaeota archaeon]|nr:DMT family transporter [Candidatus Pacearchaeota archaeon]
MNTFWALIFAVLSPIIWAFMNILDKYVVSCKAKSPLSYSALAGLVNLLIGIVLAVFISWEGIAINNLLYSAIAGILLGSQFFFYYIFLKEEDASNLVGLIYVYPVFVALLSFLFLNEILPLISYFGICLILTGVLLLSLRMKKIKMKVSLWIVSVMIVVVALYEFFIKISTNNIPEINGMAINSIFLGLTVLCILFHKKTRKLFPSELRNFGWAVFTEILTFFAVFTTYLAMAGLEATIVSSAAAIQPLAALIFERIASRFKEEMTRDKNLWPKLIGICLIISGVILLYLPKIIEELS